jgi:hypothetical protein
LHEQPSSTIPLQLLSLPSQISVVGITSAEQEPQEPFTHFCEPLRQTPTPSVAAGPE